MSASGRGTGRSTGLPKGGDAEADVFPEDMNDKRLSDEIGRRRRLLDEMGDRLEELAQRIEEARFGPREGRRERVDDAQRRHNEGKALYDQLRDELAALEDEQAHRRRNAEARPRRPRVNGWGEATDRYITTQSYESAQRRLDKRIQSWMGW